MSGLAYEDWFLLSARRWALYYWMDDILNAAAENGTVLHHIADSHALHVKTLEDCFLPENLRRYQCR